MTRALLHMDAKQIPVLLNRKQLASALGVSLRTVDVMLAARQIPAIRPLPRVVRFDLAKVHEALQQFEQPAILPGR